MQQYIATAASPRHNVPWCLPVIAPWQVSTHTDSNVIYSLVALQSPRCYCLVQRCGLHRLRLALGLRLYVILQSLVDALLCVVAVSISRVLMSLHDIHVGITLSRYSFLFAFCTYFLYVDTVGSMHKS